MTTLSETQYVLPIRRQPDGGIIYNIYEFNVLRTFGVKNSVGSLACADLETLRAAKGRRRYNVDNSRLPTFVAFAEEGNPKSISRPIFRASSSPGWISKPPMSQVIRRDIQGQCAKSPLALF